MRKGTIQQHTCTECGIGVVARRYPIPFALGVYREKKWWCRPCWALERARRIVRDLANSVTDGDRRKLRTRAIALCQWTKKQARVS